MAFERVIPSGDIQTVPFKSVAISGLASWDGNNLKITGFDVAQMQQIKILDGLYINGELAIISGLPASLGASIINVQLLPSRRFTTTFTDEAIQWTRGLKWADFPLEWHIYGDDFDIGSNNYNAAIGFTVPVLPFLVEALNDTYVGLGNIIAGSGITVANFANTDLTFTGNRQHNLNGYSAIIRESGVHSLQIGADVPEGMIPIPNLKFSGYTGSNASESLMTLNGMLKGYEGASDIYLPISIALQGDPFGEDGGKFLTSGIYIEPDGNGGYNVDAQQSIVDTINNIYITKLFQRGDYFIVDATNNDIIKWLLGKDGRFISTGAESNKPVVYTGGGDYTIPDNVSTVVYNPATVQSGSTITLPLNPPDGHKLEIIGGGTITTGNVITGFALDGNGRTVIGNGESHLRAGLAYRLRYIEDTDTWYA